MYMSWDPCSGLLRLQGFYVLSKGAHPVMCSSLGLMVFPFSSHFPQLSSTHCFQPWVALMGLTARNVTSDSHNQMSLECIE